MKGFIEVYDQRTQFLKDIFLSHGYQINDKQAQNLDFYVVKNQKIDHDNTFSLNNINTKYIINNISFTGIENIATIRFKRSKNIISTK